MSIPDFEPSGLLPEGRHEATEEEVHEHLVAAFASSVTRTGIHQYWRQHRLALGDLVQVRSQWLDGSFATAKPDPDDVDIVTVIDGPSYDGLPRHRQLLVQTLIQGTYTERFWQCDSHALVCYDAGHVGHNQYLVAAERLAEYFGHDREGGPKGFVEVAGPETAR